MEKKFNSKGIEFVPKNDVSIDAKLKLNKLIKDKNERLERPVSAYKNGKLLNQAKQTMLNYTSDESSQSSHFIINTETENIILLSFNKLNEEDLFFNNDFLQDNILEMTIAKVATNNDCFCKELALTVKHIFDFILEKEHNKIIYASLPYNCLKHQLIMRYIKDDENDHFKVFSFVIDNKVLFFFFNEEKTSSVDVLKALTEFFSNEYGVDFAFK